jgi:hypothetical protein
VSERADRLGALSRREGWRPLTAAARVHAWTDDYSNLLKSIRW